MEEVTLRMGEDLGPFSCTLRQPNPSERCHSLCEAAAADLLLLSAHHVPSHPRVFHSLGFSVWTQGTSRFPQGKADSKSLCFPFVFCSFAHEDLVVVETSTRGGPTFGIYVS